MEHDRRRFFDRDGSVKRQYLAAILMSTPAFCFGCSIGWLSPSLATLRSNQSPLGEPISSRDEAFLASVLCLGAVAGTSIFFAVLEKFGRKVAGLLSALLFVASWALKLSTSSLPSMLAARVLAGAGGSGSLLMSPLYGAEVSSPRCKTFLGSMGILAMNIGILLAFTLGAFVEYQKFVWILFAIPVGSFVMMSWMPETPVYLVKTGKDEKATAEIAWLRNISIKSKSVELVLEQIKKQPFCKNTCLRYSSTREIVMYPVSLKALAVCMVMVTLQGFVGIYAMVSFSSVIFEEAQGSFSSSTSSIILAVQQLSGSLASVLLLNKIERKVLLISSSAAVSLSLAGLGTYLYFKEMKYDTSSFVWMPVAFLSLVVMASSVGLGPIPSIIASEVFIAQAYETMNKILTIWTWIMAFLVSHFFNSMFTFVGSYGTYWCFAAAALHSAVFTYLFVPETRGRRLEDILKHFQKDFNYSHNTQHEMMPTNEPRQQ